jgi:protein-tyrosine phosphatase
MNYINFFKSNIYVFYDRLKSFTIEDSKSNIENIETKRLFIPVPKLDQIITFYSQPTHIIDNIYLGSAYNASHYDTLINNNIKLILNITTEISNYYESLDNFIYKNYKINDNNKESIKKYLLDTYEIINLFQLQNNNNNNILIHCFMGASRSVSVVIYYLMKKHNMSLANSIIYIKKKRQIINPTILFYKELNEFDLLI